jgi:hypothetical protein
MVQLRAIIRDLTEVEPHSKGRPLGYDPSGGCQHGLERLLEGVRLAGPG